VSLFVDVELQQGAFQLAARFESAARTLGLFGPSGSGKTSLVEILAGWRRPHRGRIVVDGAAWFDRDQRVDLAPARRRVGYVPQDLLLLPHWSVEENLRAGVPRGDRRANEERLARAVDVLGIGQLLARRPSTLSGGERQRVALARALACDPALLLLDEPLASLDASLRRAGLALLARVRDAFDVPIVIVSHDPTEILSLCQECVRLDAGRVVEHGPARRVLLGAARASGTFENVLSGRATAGGEPRVELAPGVELHVAERGLAPGRDVLVAVRAEDVLVATGELPLISARNTLPARVEDVRLEGDDAWIEAQLAPGVLVSALVTPAAVRELALARGRAVRLVIKAQACRLLADA
jgi:molybdate transport system ATP-binding protein